MAADDKKYILYPNNSRYHRQHDPDAEAGSFKRLMVKYELNKRTGLNPTIVFLLNCGTYPSYSWRGSHGNDGRPDR